jgi:hypothetical protein
MSATASTFRHIENGEGSDRRERHRLRAKYCDQATVVATPVDWDQRYTFCKIANFHRLILQASPDDDKPSLGRNSDGVELPSADLNPA